ncbi:MAG: RNA methyltransferase [Gemmatimonadaceae bacterium]
MKLLTLARDLQRRKARDKHGLFVAEGVRTVETLLASPCRVTGLLVSAGATTPAAPESPAGGAGGALVDRLAAVVADAVARGIPVGTVSEAEFASAASTDSPQGVLAIAEIPQRTLAAPATVGRYLLLDALQDPGNVGTILRTAAAFGVTATMALPGTVDLWNAKVVRSTMGALFAHPAVALTWEEARAFLATHAVACWAGDVDGDPLPAVLDGDMPAIPARLAVVVSNEGAGLSAALRDQVDRRVAIPMAPGVESLNVAVATGILLYALRPDTTETAS